MTKVEIEIDYDAPEPPHRQIAAWLRKKIESGEYPPGRKIPSEKDIMDLSGVARTTVRRAIAVLRDEGLVVTTPGRGTHVVKHLYVTRSQAARRHGGSERVHDGQRSYGTGANAPTGGLLPQADRQGSVARRPRSHP